MSELDRIAHSHARAVNTALAQRETPPMGTRATPLGRGRRRGVYAALVAAALVTILGLPFVLSNSEGDVATSSVPVPPTVTDGTIQTAVPGWSFSEFDFDIREGSAYVATNELFFVWGGAPDRSGDLRNDGFLGLLDGLRDASATVPDAPISGRYLPTMVWTGSEFIVFGGHDFENAHNDGVAFDPARGSWRTIPPAPIEPDRYPSSVWTGSEMVVWMDNQLAAYDPAADSWTPLPAPPVQVTDAVLFSDGSEVTLMGGPYMRDVGEIGVQERLRAARLDLATGEWTEIEGGPFADLGRPTIGPDGEIYVMTSPSMHVFEDGRWRAIGPTHHCAHDLAMASGSGHVFVDGVLDGEDPAAPGAGGCAIYEFDGSWVDITRVLEWNAYGQTVNTYGSGFVATPDGRLVTFADAHGATAERVSGRAVLGVYDPDGG